MAVSASKQLILFLLSVLGGICTGVFFDLFRTFRRLIRSGTVWVGVQDLLFWIVSACAAFLFLFRFNDGEIRWYILCGLLLGALLYHLTAQDHLVRLFTAAARGLCRLMRFILRTAALPFVLLYRLLSPIFRFFGKIGRKIYAFFRKKMRTARANFVAQAKKIKKRKKMY